MKAGARAFIGICGMRKPKVGILRLMRHLIILGIRGIPAAHGGFETFAERLAIFLRDCGWRVTVYCQAKSGKRLTDEWNGINRVHIPTRLSGALGTVEFDAKCVSDVRKMSGTILTLGYNTGFLSAWLSLKKRKNFINMDGLEWKRSKYSVAPRIYLWLNERIAANAGTLLIADHPAIAAHLSTRVSSDRIKVIPYGGEGVTTADPAPLAKMGLSPKMYFTLIARPEPENSILEIVRAFSLRTRGVKLAVLGNYSSERRFEQNVLNCASDEVLFLGPIYDSTVLAALRFHSLAYLHGHQVGGTNPSLVESLGAGNAVIAHDNKFNRWVAESAARYFRSEDDLDKLLTELITSPTLRDQMSLAAYARWKRDFTWTSVLNAYKDILESI